jgi:hypothetical protein
MVGVAGFEPATPSSRTRTTAQKINENNVFMEHKSMNERETFAHICAVAVPFEDWLDQQVLPPEIAEHANFVLAYLRMDQPLPAPLLAKLDEHVTALCNGRL